MSVHSLSTTINPCFFVVLLFVVLRVDLGGFDFCWSEELMLGFLLVDVGNNLECVGGRYFCFFALVVRYGRQI